MFAGLYLFASNRFGVDMDRIRADFQYEGALPLVLGFTLAIVAGYLLAGRRALAELGGTISVVAVVAIYYYCNILLDHSIGANMLALAAPAVLHLASVEFRRAAVRAEAAVQTATPANKETPAAASEAPAEVPEPAGELVGAA